jgi:uncharacterized protein (TIGR02145 family)
MLNAQDLPSYVPTDGLVAYYPFNGNANDESGNGYHGAVNGATLTADRSGNIESAYYFDQSSWIETSDTFSISAQNVSVCAWFYCNNDISSMTAQIISVNTSPSEHSLQLEISANNALYFNALPYGETITPSNTFEYDSWNFVTGTFDGTTETIYLNGQKIIEKNRTGDFSIVNQKINFGRQTFATTDYWYGKIDDVSIWNRALSEQEIQNLYTSSSGDILLNGTVSAENNQIKNVADPTDAQDAVTKEYLLEKIANLQDQIDYIMNKDNQTDDDGDGYTEVEGDCDDLNASIRPQVKEVADGIDNNCDGNIDEGYNYTPVIDIDGNSYNYVAYANQVWTVKNAEVVTYRDGTEIPQVTDATEWENLTTGAWCYYDNDPTKGKLYNWYAVMGIHDTASLTDASLRKAFAPEGWHVPTDAEWTTLEEHLIANGYNYDGTTTENKIAKAMASTTGWNSSTSTGVPGNDQSLNNSSGFNAFPEGSRYNDGSFYNEGDDAIFWSSTEYNTYLAWNRYLYINGSYLYRYDYSKRDGFSVRFVRD